jgi:hypothetical protein
MTNNKQQTAVEWLIRTLDLDNNPFNMKIINRAKEMEKQIIIDAIITCEKEHYAHSTVYPSQFVIDKAEQYYNETYGNDKQ